MNHSLVAVVTLLALLVFFWTAIRVGGARGKYGIKAPATSGHEEFDRHFRVQMNTLEGLVIFIPSLWIFALYGNDRVAAAAGLVWIVGRVLYALGYVKDPSQRRAGFAISSLSLLFLLFGGLIVAGMAVAQTGI